MKQSLVSHLSHPGTRAGVAGGRRLIYRSARQEEFEAAMRLMCRLGLHRPAAGEVWNRGYWFTTCEGCGADMVRTAAGRWHVPHGKKIVWKTRKPRTERKRDD